MVCCSSFGWIMLIDVVIFCRPFLLYWIRRKARQTSWAKKFELRWPHRLRKPLRRRYLGQLEELGRFEIADRLLFATPFSTCIGLCKEGKGPKVTWGPWVQKKHSSNSLGASCAFKHAESKGQKAWKIMENSRSWGQNFQIINIESASAQRLATAQIRLKIQALWTAQYLQKRKQGKW